MRTRTNRMLEGWSIGAFGFLHHSITPSLHYSNSSYGRRTTKRTEQTGHLHDNPGGAVQLGPEELGVAAAVRVGVLRDRDDCFDDGPLRPGEVWRGGVSPVAAAGGLDDCGGDRNQENGAASGAALQPDAGAEVRDRDGGVRDFGRAVQAGLQCAQGD